MVAPAGNPSLILLTTKGTDDFYSGGTVTLLNTNNTSNLTYTLSEEKPLYVGRFYNYDNIDELNNHIPGAVNGMVAPAGNPSLILLTT
jgi:hypothetical protein